MAEDSVKVLASEPLFYGRDAAVARGLSAEEYVKRLQGLADVNNWEDAVHAKRFLRGFREEAFIWWENWVEASFDNDVAYQDLAADIEGILALFKKKYFVVRGMGDTDLEWLSLRQPPNEPTNVFFERIVCRSAYFSKFARQNAPANPAPNEVVAWRKQVSIRRRNAVDTFLNDGTELAQDVKSLLALGAEQKNNTSLVTTIRALCLMVARFGCHDGAAKQLFLNALLDKKSLNDIHELLVRHDAAKASGNGHGTGNHTNGSRNGRGHAHEVAPAPANPAPGAAPATAVAAASGQGGGNNRRRRNRKKKTAAQEADASAPVAASAPANGKRCTFCEADGHEEPECRNKLRAKQEILAKRKAFQDSGNA